MKLIYILFLSLFLASPVFSHCQIPCGIYDDKAAFSELRLHTETIHKSIDMITALSADDIAEKSVDQKAQHDQQFTRWIINKEQHASKIQHLVSDYFLTQRIKSTDKRDRFLYRRYLDKLAAAHQIIFYAMKSKQTLELENITKLNEFIDELEKNLDR